MILVADYICQPGICLVGKSCSNAVATNGDQECGVVVMLGIIMRTTLMAISFVSCHILLSQSAIITLDFYPVTFSDYNLAN